jgi:hypothetical protein
MRPEAPESSHPPTPCYGAFVSTDIHDGAREDEAEGLEDLEDLVENEGELRALVRETLRQELRPLDVLAAVMIRWATTVEIATARLREQRG